MANELYDALFAPHARSEAVFIHTTDGQKITFKEFVTLAGRVANALFESELRQGDRIALQVEKSVEALAVYAACVQSGLVFLPLNIAYTPAEVEYFLEDSGARAFICDPGKLNFFESVAQAFGITLSTLGKEGEGSLMAKTRQFSGNFETVDADTGSLAAILYTSGTTGRSKGAMLTQGNLLSNARVLTDYWCFERSDRLLHALPIFHTHGLFVAVNVCLLSGASIIWMSRFDVDTVKKHLLEATTMMGVPTFYTRLLADSDFDASLVSNIRLFISGSAPLRAETHIEFENRTGHRILERYGMTETNMNTSNPYLGERRPGTVGFPLPGVELKVTDPDTGETMDDGQIGVLEVRGDNVFKGYWNMPEKTREELRADGFFITGDLGRIDSDGYVHIIGRGKDLIISGGLNIYPKEIEQFLDQQPGVLESAVVGVPHPDFGETPIGVLVAEVGLSIDLEHIKKALLTDLARFKHPRELVIVEELPRNTMGKVQKNNLQQRYGDLFK